MKHRMLIVTALVLLCALLSGCGMLSERTLIIDGKEAEIFPEEDRITFGKDIYAYISDENGIFITYPNGYIYQKNETTGGWDIPADAPYFEHAEDLGYLPEDLLCAFVESADPVQRQAKISPFVSILLIGVGALCAIFPKSAWRLSSRGRRSEEEPSSTAIWTQRIGGILLILAGIITLLR